jgi:hypothetical protein
MRKYSDQVLNEIHLDAVESVQKLKSCEADVIVNLQKVCDSRVYEYMGCKNLYTYAVQCLKIPEGQAYAFTSVAGKAAKLPDLQEAILAGEISVSMAKRVVSVINESNEAEWVDALKTKTKREIEKEVAKENPRAAVPEQARYVSEKIIELKVGFSEENYEILKRSQDLCAQKLGRHVSLEETITYLGREFNERTDPVKKAKRAHERTERNQSEGHNHKKDEEIQFGSEKLCPGTISRSVTVQRQADRVKDPKNKPARQKPATVYHAVNLRDKGQCQARMPNGKICGDAKWVDTHHILEVSRGGPTTAENLITLCRAHHRMWHQICAREGQTRGGKGEKIGT